MCISVYKCELRAFLMWTVVCARPKRPRQHMNGRLVIVRERGAPGSGGHGLARNARARAFMVLSAMKEEQSGRRPVARLGWEVNRSYGLLFTGHDLSMLQVCQMVKKLSIAKNGVKNRGASSSATLGR